MFKTALLQKNVSNFETLKTDFSPSSANKPQSSLVLCIQSLKSDVTVELGALVAGQI